MKDKEMIEEMASIICESTSNRGTCNECGFKRHERFGFIYQCHNFDSAERIYNAGYRKVPEDSVMLSRKEYDDMYSFKTTRGGFYNILDTVRKVERMETAKEILQKILLLITCWDGRNVHINHDELVELGKKYDVDMRVVEE